MNVTSAADSVARGLHARPVTGHSQVRPVWVVSALGACRSAEGLCGAHSIDFGWSPGVRRSDLGRTDGTADAVK
jgi:hypothetical protein